MSQHKFSHTQLVEFLGHQVNISGDKTVAVLLIALRRTDRLDAITGKVSLESILDHADRSIDSLLRPADRYAHIGGEQILLVLPGLANKDHSVLAAIRIIAMLKESFMVGNHSVSLRPYIGVANYPDAGRNGDTLLMHADYALQIATTEEDGFYVHQPKDFVEPNIYDGLDIELDKAISTNELCVNFQPKISIETGQCISVEALLRWTAPWGQEINPGLLVATAENSGLINPLSLWILNTALRHTAAFSQAGVGVGVSVNLPPKMLEDEELPQVIQQALDIWGIPASTLTLEITEDSMINNIESSLGMLTRLRELGLRLSIDDFGTGYSSLAYLKRLPVQELKIDILFIRNIHNSIRDKHLVQTIIDLAHNFDLITVAEGVEDQQTFDLLRELGCDVVQGFLFSKALSEAEFLKWYQKYTK